MTILRRLDGTLWKVKTWIEIVRSLQRNYGNVIPVMRAVPGTPSACATRTPVHGSRQGLLCGQWSPSPPKHYKLAKIFPCLELLHIGKEEKKIGHYHVKCLVTSSFALLCMLSPSGGHMPLCEKGLDKITTSHIVGQVSTAFCLLVCLLVCFLAIT